MEQNGVSIIPPSGITENSVGKSIGISFRSNSTIQSAKKRLKTSWSKQLLHIEENGTMTDKLLLALGELIGTAILVLIGCTASVGGITEKSPSHLQTAVAGGMGIMIAIQCVGHISGAHINPAITVASVIFGNKSLPMAFLYIIAQCLGSVTGYGLLKMVTPENNLYNDNQTNSSFCTTDIGNLSEARGFAVEALATGILVFFTYGIWDSRNAKNTDSTSLRFGFCVIALSLAFAPYTGCSMNPARSIGPAIWNNSWKNHWIYWVGPIGGSVVASLIYRCLFLPVTKEKEDTTQDIETFNGIET